MRVMLMLLMLIYHDFATDVAYVVVNVVDVVDV